MIRFITRLTLQKQTEPPIALHVLPSLFFLFFLDIFSKLPSLAYGLNPMQVYEF